jgi:phage tail-like protein
MAQFSVGAQRLDPYKNFKFRLLDGDRLYFGSKSTGLFPLPEVVKHRAGDDPSTSVKSPGRNKYDAITLDRGVTQDLSFSDWASQVWDFGSTLGSETSAANFRKNIYLEFYNEAGELVVSYRMSGRWVSELQTVPPVVLLHCLHPRGPASIQEQLAVIFESSLERPRP